MLKRSHHIYRGGQGGKTKQPTYFSVTWMTELNCILFLSLCALVQIHYLTELVESVLLSTISCFCFVHRCWKIRKKQHIIMSSFTKIFS